MKNNLEINLTELEPITQSEIIKTLDSLKNKFPLIFQNLEYVGVKSNMGEIYASTEKTNKFIFLNPKYFSNRDEFLRLLKSKGESSFFLEDCDTIDAIISHEFGHIIHNSYLLQDDVYLIPILIKGKSKLLSKNPNVGTVADIMGRWIDHGNLPEISAKYVLTQKNSSKRKREAFAESFSSIIHTSKVKWEPCVKLINELIMFIENNPKYSITAQNNDNPLNIQIYDSVKADLLDKFGINLEKDYVFKLG